MPGTVMPSPKFREVDANGDPLDGGMLYTYQAGTTTLEPTYADQALLVPNTNPVILDGSGRATVFLSPTIYDMVLKDRLGNIVWSQAGVGAVPGFGSASDVLGTAGEAISARDAVAMSDGSVAMGGSSTAGKWVKMDADVPERSVIAGLTGVAPAAIALGAVGTIRLAGSIDTFAGLTPGADYFASSTAGLLTAAPPYYRRLVGKAASATELIVRPESSEVVGVSLLDTPIHFGGNSHQTRNETAYPTGSTADTLVPGSVIQRFAQSKLPPGTYKLEAMLATENATAAATAALYNLTDDLEISGSEITTTSVVGARARSATITINHADSTERDYGIKIKTGNSSYPVYCWGAKLLREV